MSRQPKEDVTYASIDHSTAKGSKRTRATTDDDCDYTTVNVPAALPPESECSSRDECEDDYVLMGWIETRLLEDAEDHKQEKVSNIFAIELLIKSWFSMKIKKLWEYEKKQKTKNQSTAAACVNSKLQNVSLYAMYSENVYTFAYACIYTELFMFLTGYILNGRVVHFL